MKSKAERRSRHLSAPRVRKSIIRKSSTNSERIIKRNGKSYKVIVDGNRQYFIELKLTR
jgi:hypothetical protein